MSGARPDTWMPVYIGDYLADTMHLSTGEHGAYLLLIFSYWRIGKPLVDDDQELASICRMQAKDWKRIRERIGRFFQIGDGVWRHKRIEQELERCQEISAKRSGAGAIGAAKRWHTHSNGIANAMANGEQNDANHSHSHNNSSLRSELSDGKPKRGSRLPEGWQPAEQSYQLGAELGLNRSDVDGEVPEFGDYWRSIPGQRGCKLDWDATFNNRLREIARRRKREDGRSGRMVHRQKPNSLIAAASAVLAQIEGEQ
jgi:uncharacterized protein YdaU (DUF1376 family)